MPERTTPYPLPDPAIAQLPPDALAGVAASVARRMYGIELDYSPASLKRLNAVLGERCRLGQYTAESFPDSLALALGAYVGVVLQRHLPAGQWGTSAENLYRTPLPFLLFSRGEFERQINVVEDCLTLFWMGEGLLPHEYYQYHAHGLERLGFRIG
ncbi:MAG: hypothetical protein ACYDCO_23865 [Armatimonadota bacterium]